MYRFFVEPSQIEEHVIHVTGSDYNHIRNVLRMKIGETIYLSDGDKLEYTCQIKDYTEDTVEAEILYMQETDYELPCKVVLFQSLAKGEKMELIIQKAVELGVAEIVPVASKRCVMKLDAKKAANKGKRWQGIAESAAKQAKRMIIPEVTPVLTFREALKKAAGLDVRLIPYELAKDMQVTREAFAGITPGQSVGIFIGPEGGFAPEEIEEALANDIRPITLGKRILRTETAGMTVLSILMYHLEP